MSCKIEVVPEWYELVRIGRPKEGEFYIRPDGDVIQASFSFEEEAYPIVRKIEPPKPIEPPEGYRLLGNDEIVGGDILFSKDAQDEYTITCVRSSIGKKPTEVDLGYGQFFARKITPKVRPMTRAEFLAAWKQRNFCPLIDPDGDIDTVSYVTDDTEFDHDCVSMFNNGWSSMDELSRFKFASDETYLTIEE